MFICLLCSFHAARGAERPASYKHKNSYQWRHIPLFWPSGDAFLLLRITPIEARFNSIPVRPLGAALGGWVCGCAESKGALSLWLWVGHAEAQNLNLARAGAASLCGRVASQRGVCTACVKAALRAACKHVCKLRVSCV